MGIGRDLQNYFNAWNNLASNPTEGSQKINLLNTASTLAKSINKAWASWKKGIISFVAGVTNKIAFGQARSDSYDELGSMIAGGALGAIYGDVSDNWPYNKANKSILGVSGGRSGNTIVWGAIGAGLGKVAYNAGDIPQAVVQLRMSV